VCKHVLNALVVCVCLCVCVCVCVCLCVCFCIGSILAALLRSQGS
jgi:hypothetical protein